MNGKIIIDDMHGRREVERERAPLPCFVCRKELWNIFNGHNQPDNSCTFNSHGHYGSTVFDEMDGSQLEINVCDECLKAGRERGAIGYWPGHPPRAMKPWEDD